MKFKFSSDFFFAAPSPPSAAPHRRRWFKASANSKFDFTLNFDFSPRAAGSFDSNAALLNATVCIQRAKIAKSISNFPLSRAQLQIEFFLFDFHFL